MIERDKREPETAEQFGKGLLEFVENTEFGTPQYQAVSDFYDLQRLYSSLRQDLKNVLTDKANPEKSFVFESQVKVSEMKIALLEHEISQNQSRVQEYSSAYIHIGIGFEDLITVAYREAENIFPGDKEEQRSYVDKIYGGVFDKAQDVIYGKRD